MSADKDLVINIEGLSKKYQLHHERVNSIKDLAKKVTKRKRSGSGWNEEFYALKGLDLQVRRGEVVGILGRNGAGKSTLLKLLARITAPSEGKFWIKGQLAALLEVGTGFHPELTGRENIYMNGSILGMRRPEIERKFDDIVDFSGISTFLDNPVKTYSSGMYVRLAFSVAAHLDSEVMIIDEVLAVGDADFQQRCFDRMQTAAKDGRTVLFVSHSASSVQKLCERGLVLQDGQMVYDGTAVDAIGYYFGALQNKAGLETAKSYYAKVAPNPELKAQVLEAKILNAGGEFQTFFEKEETVWLEFSFEIRQPVKGLYSAFEVIRRPESLFLSFEIDREPELQEQSRSAGIYRKAVQLPPWLKPGDYDISLSLRTNEQVERIHVQEELLSFTVEEQQADKNFSYSKTRRGVVMTQLKYLDL